MYQLGRYLRCSQNRNSAIYKITAALVDPIAFVNSFIWNDVEYTSSESNACNYTGTQSELSLFSGTSTVYYENTNRFKTGFMIGAKGKLYLLPYYGQESDISKFVKDTMLIGCRSHIDI